MDTRALQSAVFHFSLPAKAHGGLFAFGRIIASRLIACQPAADASGNLTHNPIAQLVGVRRETIMRLEKAQYNPSLNLAVDLSRAVGAPIEALFLFP